MSLIPTQAWPWIAGAIAAAIIPLLTLRARGLLMTNGQFSTSKVQFLIWTEVALFAYAVLFTAHATAFRDPNVWCKPAPPPQTNQTNTPAADRGKCGSNVPGGTPPLIPDHLLLLMGLALTTTTLSQIKPSPNTKLLRGFADPVTPRLGEFLSDANGDASLAKFQMLAWTVVAAAVYLYTTWSAYGSFVTGLASAYPDVDVALLALVGLGQATFVGNRFTDSKSTD